MNITAYQLAERFVGLREIGGNIDNPQVMAMLKLDAQWPESDEVPWCSAFVNYVAWLLRLTRSKSLRARSWLEVGRPVSLSEAKPGFDVIVLSRGKGEQPGPEVIKAPGHVGFYAGRHSAGASVDPLGCAHILGGNQGNEVNIKTYDLMTADGHSRLLGIRRLFDE